MKFLNYAVVTPPAHSTGKRMKPVQTIPLCWGTMRTSSAVSAIVISIALTKYLNRINSKRSYGTRINVQVPQSHTFRVVTKNDEVIVELSSI